MKLLFSEAHPDYPHYVFPYAIWAFPEAGEGPADLFQAGFLPSSPNLDRFYMARHVRVALAEFKLSSENRRILRKGAGITSRLVERADWELTERRRDFCQQYTQAKFGPEAMTRARLDRVLNSRLTSHILEFTDSASGQEVGFATLYIEPGRIAYYYYAFYDLAFATRSLGLYMMTTAVAYFAEANLAHLYLGTCYSCNALYKTQFSGAQFFNGVLWSDNMSELRHLIERQARPQTEHLWESEEFRRTFYPGETVSYISS